MKGDHDAAWFRDQIEAIFGDSAQSKLSDFLIACGDHRERKTTRRTISNYACGVHRVSGEMRALLFVLRNSREAQRILYNIMAGLR
jgi:hypothetical protein